MATCRVTYLMLRKYGVKNQVLIVLIVWPAMMDQPVMVMIMVKLTFQSRVLHAESWCAWQHLSNAGLVDGQYTCSFMSTPAIGDTTSNSEHLPRFIVDYIVGGAIPLYYMPGKTVIEIRAQGVNWPALRPTSVHYMDMKQDDGLPFKGKLQSINPFVFLGIYFDRYKDCTTTTDPENRHL